MPRKRYNFHDALFAPVIESRDGLVMHEVGDNIEPENAAKYRRWYEEWQSASEAVRITSDRLPDAFIESLVFGTLLSDNVLDAQFIGTFGTLGGSSGIGASKNSMVANLFSNTVTADPRINMQYIRAGVPKARSLVKEMVDSNNVEAMQAAIKNAVAVYTPAISAFGSITSDHWNESVYRFDRLVQAVDQLGIDHEAVGLDRRTIDKLEVSKQISDLWNEAKDIEASLPKEGALTGADREKRIRAEAITALAIKLGNDHHGIADSYGVASSTYGDIAANLAVSEKKALYAPLTNLERRILEKGAEDVIAEYTATLTKNYTGKEISSLKPVHFGYTTLKKEVSATTYSKALWEGMEDLHNVFDYLKGVDPEIDRRAENVMRLRAKLAAEPDELDYSDIAELKLDAERLRQIGSKYVDLLINCDSENEFIPPNVTFNDKGAALYKGVDPGKLEELSGLSKRLDDMDFNEIKNVPLLRSFTEIKDELTALGSAFAADTGKFSKNSGEYTNLCRAMTDFRNCTDGDAQIRFEYLFKCAMDYQAHVGGHPKNARQARRLELCEKMLSTCVEYSFIPRLHKSYTLDGKTPEEMLQYRKQEIADRASAKIEAIIPSGSKFTVTRDGDGFKIRQTALNANGTVAVDRDISKELLGRYLYYDAVRKNVDRLPTDRLDMIFDEKTIKHYEKANGGSSYLNDALASAAAQGKPVTAETIESSYVGNRIIDSNKEAWSKMPDDKLIELRQKYQQKLTGGKPAEKDMQIFTKLTQIMADRNMSGSAGPKKPPQKNQGPRLP